MRWALAIAVGLVTLAVTGASGAAPPTVVSVEIRSAHRILEERVRAITGGLTGAPRWRGALRETVERLWALGLFSEVRVEEVAVPEGVSLRFHVVRAPFVAEVTARGDLGLDVAEVMAAARLPRGGRADAEALARARADLRALYEREGFLAARVDIESVVNPETNGHAVTISVDAGERARVGRAQVKGGERFGEAFVEKVLQLREGARYREGALRDGVQALEKLYRDKGFVGARVEAATAPREGGRLVDVEVTITEGVHVRLVFEGVDALPESRLREAVTFADAGVVDELELRSSERRIAAAYRAEGFAFATVEAAVHDEGPDRVVTVRVTEGPRVSVAAVDLPGAAAVPAERLRARLSTRPPGLLRRGYFSRDVLEQDVRLLALFLQEEGYPDATVGPPAVTFSEDRTRAHVVIPVHEGTRVTVGAVGIEGARALSEQEARAALGVKPGDPWSEARVDLGRQNLERRYARHGFHGVDVTAGSARHDGVADVTYRVVEGEQTRVGRILVEGLALTREGVVRREIALRPGQPLNPDALLETRRRLADTGLFDRVDVEPLRPPPQPFADVVVAVQERKPWHFDLGAGYTTFEGLRGFVEVGHDNLFGTGRSLALRGRVSQRGDREDLLYVEPFVLGTRWRGDANLFREHEREIGYDFERFGLSLGIRRDLFTEVIRGLRGYLRYEISRIDRFNVDQSLLEADVIPGTETVATLTPELSLDRRDRPFDPSRGSYHDLALRVGGLGLGGDADFVKTRLESHWFFDWIPSTVVALSARVGVAWGLLGTTSLPVEERFFAGGSTTVRGYRELRLGPVDARGNPTGGNASVVLNAEWRFPVWRWLGGTLFVDSGTVAPEVQDLSPRDMKSGIGAGLRVSTPVGPLRVDVGYPLDVQERQDQKLRVYVTVGNPF